MHTARCTLRRFHLGDLENMRRLEGDPGVMRFAPSRVALSPELVESRLRAQVEKNASQEPLGVWAAELTATGEFVGWFMLLERGGEFPELGYMLVREQWGKGLASEVAAALVEFGVGKRGFRGITAITDADNEASIRVLEKVGFRLEGTRKKWDQVLNREMEMKVFAFRVKA